MRESSPCFWPLFVGGPNYNLCLSYLMFCFDVFSWKSCACLSLFCEKFYPSFCYFKHLISLSELLFFYYGNVDLIKAKDINFLLLIPLIWEHRQSGTKNLIKAMTHDEIGFFFNNIWCCFIPLATSMRIFGRPNS